MAHARTKTLLTTLPLATLPLAVLLLMCFFTPAHAEEEETVNDPSGIVGMEHFPGTRAERARLLKGGFLVLPRYRKQIFQPYIGGPLAYYITCDSAHWTFHVLLETALSAAEKAMAADLGPQLVSLHARLYRKEHAPPGGWSAAFERAAAQLAIAARLTGREVPLPKAAEPAAKQELALILAASGKGTSPLDGRVEDYGDYKPRGMYAGNPVLEAHFRTVKFLSRRGLRIEEEVELRAAILIARSAFQDATLLARWKQRDEMLGWLVGPADDLDLSDYVGTIGRVTNGDWSNASLEHQFNAIRVALRELPDPEINTTPLSLSAWRDFRTKTKGLRLFPARRTPDAWLFQTLYEKQGGDPPRTGLEVADALGSTRARLHLSPRIGAEVRAGFEERLGETFYDDSLRTAAILFDEKSALLGAVKPAAVHAITAAPFLRTGAWRDRLLTTSLGSWACLRHAFALHAKTAMYALGMTRDMAGQVEPTPAYFAALGKLARDIRTRCDTVGAFRTGDPKQALGAILPVLRRLELEEIPTTAEMTALQGVENLLSAFMEAQQERGAGTGITAVLKRIRLWIDGKVTLDAKETEALAEVKRTDTWERLGDFATLMTFLEKTAEGGLRGEDQTAETHERIQGYGKELARLNFFDGNSWLSPQKQMGLVIDVAVDPSRNSVLEVGVGAAMEMYLVLPDKKFGRRLYVGGVYSYYEFLADTRWNDETWLARVQGRRLPPLPAWTKSYIAPLDPEAIIKRIEAGEVFEEIANIHHPRIGRALIEALRSGALKTSADDKRMSWIADSLEAYAGGKDHREMFDLLLDRLLRAPAYVGSGKEANPRKTQEEEEEVVGDASQFTTGGPASLGQMIQAEDVPRLFALLEQPPKGARKDARARIAIALYRTSRQGITAEAAKRLSHPLAAVRWHAIDIVGWRKRQDGGRRASALLLDALAAEDNEQNQRKAFEFLRYGEVKVLTRDQSLALTRFLSSPHSDLRREAAEILGETHAREAAPALLTLARTAEDANEAQDAMEALGGALHGEGVSAQLRSEALVFLKSQLKTGVWTRQVGALYGMRQLGGAEAIASLGAITQDSSREVGLRSIAIRLLGELGTPALPYLHRMLYDETPTGDSTNSHELRLCDDAMDALDPDFQSFDLEAAGSWAKRLEKFRSKARAAGNGPGSKAGR